MSRKKTRFQNSSQNSLQSSSQNSSQSQNASDSEDSVDDSLLGLDEYIKKCVRYFVLQMGSNTPIPRSKVVQNVFKERPGKKYETVLNETSQILDKVYGLKLQLLETDKNIKKYIITNALEYPELVNNSLQHDFKSLLTILTLTHIFMSKGICSEKSLWEFLGQLSISPELAMDEINNVHTFIMKTLPKEQMIAIETKSNIYGEEASNKKLKWGPHAEQTVAKKDLLKFFSQVYDNLDVTKWSQYEDAINQFEENMRELD